MARLRDVVAYLCRHYPHKRELSNARLTKMVFLSDWKSALDRGHQLTDIEWKFNQFGPYVPDVLKTATEDEDLEVVETTNFFGDPMRLIAARDDANYPSLEADDCEILDFVIESTAPKHWDDFIRLVYSTYPIVTQPRGSQLDLVKLAQDYRDQQRLFQSHAVSTRD